MPNDTLDLQEVRAVGDALCAATTSLCPIGTQQHAGRLLRACATRIAHLEGHVAYLAACAEDRTGGRT